MLACCACAATTRTQLQDLPKYPVHMCVSSAEAQVHLLSAAAGYTLHCATLLAKSTVPEVAPPLTGGAPAVLGICYCRWTTMVPPPP